MFEKIKKILKENKLLVIIGITVFVIITILLFVFLSDKEDLKPTDQTTKENGSIGPSPEKPREAFLIRQPLGYHKNYKINLETAILDKWNDFSKDYPGFVIKESDNLGLVEKFVLQTGLQNLKYEKEELSVQIVTHYWLDENNVISYDSNRGLLYMNFNSPIAFPGVEFNPKDEESLEKEMVEFAKKYFTKNYKYSINNIQTQDNFYRIEFNRLLKELPLQLEMENEYVLLTPDGEIKEMSFLLVDFEEYTARQFPLISSREFQSNVSLMEYPKNVEFRILEPEIEAKYEPYGYILFSNPFTQEGEINVLEIRLVYLYSSSIQEMIVPVFLLLGEGFLDVEGYLAKTEFRVLASALASKYVYIHPKSHFESLE